MNLPSETTKSQQGVDQPSKSAMARMLSILWAFAEESSALTIKSLSEKLGLAPSTIHRQLALLYELGLIRRDGQSYAIGPEFERLATLVISRRSLKSLATRFMQHIASHTGEACVLMEHSPETGMIKSTALINSINPLRYDIRLGTAQPLLWGATGKSILSHLPRDRQEQIYALGIPSPADGRALPPADIYFETLDLFKRQGFAITFSETIMGAVGMGAPVFDGAGDPVGSLCITIPEIRFSKDSVMDYAAVLRAQAQALSREIGGKTEVR